jgi:hypothetical protein
MTNAVSRSFNFIVLVAVLAWLLEGTSHAQTAYPMLMSLRPVAVQAGTTVEALVSSRYSMAGAYQVLVSGEGVRGEVLPDEPKNVDAGKKPSTTDKLKIRLSAAEDALPGIRDFRIATPHGISTVGQLLIVRDSVVLENARNDIPADAQEIELPAAICGAIEKNEDVDYFKFRAEAGQSIVFRVRAARLEDRIHDLQTHVDPILTLRTAAGMTLAAADNDEYYADPVLAWRFDQAGEYLLEIRDVRYQGNQYWEYCIEASSRPLVDCTFPLAVNSDQPQLLQPLGLLVESVGELAFETRGRLAPGVHWLELPLGSERSNPVPLVVSGLPLTREGELANEGAADAQLVAAPAGIDGQIEREGDIDYFAFTAKKGEALTFEITARRVQSALDSQVRILDEKGKQLAINDDFRLGRRNQSDSLLENWIAPADGKYLVEVRDVNLHGGSRHPYFLTITRSEPYFELYLDTDKTQVCPGTCGALFVRVERKNGFAGEIQLAIDGLPAGMTADCGRILADKGQDGVIVLQTEPDAMLAAANVVVTGTAILTNVDGTKRPLSATATVYQETYLPGGGRGHWPVTAHTVAITDPADIRGITLSTYDVTLKPGESKKIEVTIDRSPGFTANVTLDMLMRHLNTTYANTLPPGVTLNDKQAKSLLAGKATQGFLTLTAAKDAPPVERQQAVVMAHVALNFVMKWTYASKPLTITVEPAEASGKHQ